ncbi:unnamed protein product [Phytophthora fragariaefolia]|uniref:Unnamed protein product n=1 Tax=Phytophthora fragariaefolia TaxID=1490495 RepID=A0A9W6TJJ7_9STRA|nr:unnamed protein product [Phytophthora fragariaefolia]
MVLAGVARPRVDTVTQKYFDRKLGVWVFVEKVPAQRPSRRRPAGTLETKEVSVTKATYRDMFISRVVPAIKARWPNASEAVVIQQDNAPAHTKPDDPQFNDAAACCGRHVELRFQPANSPDLNVLDLGLFCAIQARQRNM